MKNASSVFLCILYFWEDVGIQGTGQYVFIQLDFRILWSAVSLEVMLQFIWFIAWVFQSRKSSMWVYYFWLGVARHIQSCPNLPGLTSVPLGSLWGISWQKISQNKTLHRDTNEGKIVCETATVGWVWLGKSSCTNVCIDLERVNVVGLGVVWLH